jgi:sterol desaturase/sphingolipid hydroxylase (fatty acid hydroxylase superfamily)
MSDIFLCFGAVVALAIIFGFFAFLRYMSYRETIALAEKGLNRPERKNSKGLLRWGILITALGTALTIGLFFVGPNSGTTYPLGLGPWMLAGLVPLFLGLALILIHYLTQTRS